MASGHSSDPDRPPRDPGSLLRALPAVEKLASHPAIVELTRSVKRDLVVAAIRETLAAHRDEIRAGRETSAPDEAALIADVTRRLDRTTGASLKVLINASGTLLHTNLGRARISPEVADFARAVATGSVDLEIDLETGKRGNRYRSLARLARALTGGEEALVVNNNAAAVLLAVNSLAAGREVVASRGELVEIGGAFRMPEIVRAAGARLVEVGTTNRTRASDYERAIGPDTALLLKSHTSNYRICGFTGSPTTAELVEIGRRRSIPVFEDLGSGSLVDLSRFCLTREPTIQEVLAAGVDLVSFSTDKLLGGPQGGVLIGRSPLVRACRTNPMMRALRVDKVTMAMLEGTLKLHLDPSSIHRRIPFYEAIARTAEQIRDEIASFTARLELAELITCIQPAESRIGGGACPTDRLASYALVLEHPGTPAKDLSMKLRLGTPPVLARIHGERVILDFRTVLADDHDGLAHALSALDRGLALRASRTC